MTYVRMIFSREFGPQQLAERQLLARLDADLLKGLTSHMLSET